mgnify:CR=1 FL=1
MYDEHDRVWKVLVTFGLKIWSCRFPRFALLYPHFIHTLFGATIPLYKGVSRYFCNTFQQGVENFSALKKTLWKRHKNSGLRYGKLVEKAVYSWKTFGGFFGRVP